MWWVLHTSRVCVDDTASQWSTEFNGKLEIFEKEGKKGGQNSGQRPSSRG